MSDPRVSSSGYVGGATVEDDRFAQGARTGVHEAVPAPVFPGTEEVDQYALFSSPGYASQPPRVNPMANVALWLAASSLLLFFLSPFSLVLGGVALTRSTRLKGVGRRQSIAALVISMISMVCWLLLYQSFQFV